MASAAIILATNDLSMTLNMMAFVEHVEQRVGCQIVSTPADDSSGRPELWLGICPQGEWRKEQVFKGLPD